MAKYDINKFSVWGGKIYYDNFAAKPKQIEAYYEMMGQPIAKAPRPKLTSRVNYKYTILKKSKINKYFNTKLNNKGGSAKLWARPLSKNNGFIQVDRGDKIIKGGGKTYWGGNIKAVKKGSPGTILLGSKEWIRQIQMSIHQLQIQAESFRIALGYRAQKVFQNSFIDKKFYSDGSSKWASLSAYTLRKRAKRGTGSDTLREYGDLRKSISVKENVKAGGTTRTRVYTDRVRRNVAHHKKNTLCYAGWHNEGEGTYGSGINGRSPKPYIKRQFMGFSNKIIKFAQEHEKKYLFDMVFLNKRV